MSSIEKKRAQRLRFMNALYEVVDGLEGWFADMNAFLTELGYDFDREEHFNEFQSIAGYLKGEGLITTIHTKDRGAIAVGLTHKGVREVEAARSRPDKPTEHFPPANNISVQYMIGSQIQQGSPGATQSLTVVSQSDIEGLEAFINSLKQSVDQLELDEDQRAELEADIQTIEAQIASPKPKQEVLRPGLESIGRILEGSASAAVASPLTATVTALIGNFIQGQALHIKSRLHKKPGVCTKIRRQDRKTGNTLNTRQITR